MIDFALDGWTIKALTVDYSLTTANGTTDEARARCLKFTGTGSYTVTIPSLEKNYLVWNATTGTLTVTTGAGATAVLLTGEIVPIICDASAVKRMTLLTMSAARLQDVADPTSNQDAATKKYVDDTAFSMASGALPGQPGNAGKFLKTDGTVASWSAVSKSDVGLGSVDNTAVLGKHAIPIPATAMLQRSTNGAAFGSAETTTNKIMARTFDFDASTIEYVQFSIPMPESWDEGTVSFVPIWSHGSTTTNFKVSWGLQAVAMSDGDALDAAFGTAQFSNKTGGTTDTVYRGPESSAITVAGTPAAGDYVVFQILRKADDGTNDTLAVDARLHGITLYITTNTGTDV